jgi:hypothetical protein
MSNRKPDEKPTREHEIAGGVVGKQFQVTAWPSGLRNSSPNMLTELWADYCERRDDRSE